MAGFRHFFTIFSWNALISGQCILGGRWCGCWQKLKQRRNKAQIVEFRVAMTCTCIQKGQYFTIGPRRTCTDGGSHIRSPLPSWSPPLAPFHQSWIYMVGKKHSGKVDQPMEAVNMHSYLV